MKKLYGIMVIMLAVSSALTACSSFSHTTSASANATSGAVSSPITLPLQTKTIATNNKPKFGGTLKIIYDDMAPVYIGYPPEITTHTANASQLCIEGLLREDRQGNLVPWLATSVVSRKLLYNELIY